MCKDTISVYTGLEGLGFGGLRDLHNPKEVSTGIGNLAYMGEGGDKSGTFLAPLTTSGKKYSIVGARRGTIIVAHPLGEIGFQSGSMKELQFWSRAV